VNVVGHHAVRKNRKMLVPGGALKLLDDRSHDLDIAEETSPTRGAERQ
jgi:hypothetical protein